MHSHYFVPFKDVLSIAEEKKWIYVHIMISNHLPSKFSDSLTNSGTSQYNADRKFDSQFQYTYFHKIKKHLGFQFGYLLTIFYLKSLKRKNMSLHVISMEVEYNPYSQYN